MPEEQDPPTGPSYTPPATQDALDKIVSDRLVRERQKYSDYEDLKAKAAKFDEVETASKTELQKLQDAIAERDAQLADVPKQARQQAIRIAAAAGQAGFVDPEDVLNDLQSHGVDLADEAAVTAALAELAERKPHWVRQAERQPKIRERPKPKGSEALDDSDNGLKGKERAAAALRQFRNT